MKVRKDLESIRDDLLRCSARLSKYKKLRTLSKKHLHVSSCCDYILEVVEVIDGLIEEETTK
jgi:hypothetical protein